MRLIDADELEKKLPNDLPYKASVKRVLIQAPTVEAEPVRHGKWIPIIDEYETHSILTGYKCSLCGRCVELRGVRGEKEKPYCHCGAKMDGE